MLFKSLAAITLLATSVVADGAAIVNSLQTIDKDLAKLNSTVAAFNANLFGATSAFSILGATNQLNSDLDAATKTAQNSANLTVTGIFALITPVNQLSDVANHTLTTLINKKPEFEKLLLTGIIKLILQDSKKKSDAYSSAIIHKIPMVYQDTARNLVAPLNAGFQKAINAYS